MSTWNVSRIGVKFLSTAVSLALVTASALPQAHARPLDPLTPEELQTRLLELQHLPWSGTVREYEKSEGWSCSYSKVDLEVVDPVSLQNRRLTLTLARPQPNKKPVPVVIVIPTIEGTTPLEPEIDANLCGNGIASVVADINNNQIPEVMPSWGIEDVNNRAAIIALRTVLDWAQSDSRFDPTRMGMIGISLGGITTAMMAGIESTRLRAVVVAMGSGNLPFTMATSDNTRVTELRNRRMQHMGTSDKLVYEDILRATIKYDPLHFAPLAGRDNILFAMAQRDATVPYAMQRELHSAFGEPETLMFSGKHVPSIISLVFFNFGPVVKFFKKKFNLPNSMSPDDEGSEELIHAGL